jgi:H+/Cl- antiporter ClcA
MLPQLLRWTVLIGLWKKFHRPIVIVFFTLIALLVVSIVHQDFLSYQKSLNQVNEQVLAWSYAIKWLLYLALIAIGFIWGKKSLVQKGSLQKKMGKPDIDIKSSDDSVSETALDASDPFSNIRKKAKLRSEADFLLEQETKRKK